MNSPSPELDDVDVPLVGPVTAPAFGVMTYNVRCDVGAGPGEPDHWTDREPLLLATLRREQPALLGLQEPVAHQLAAITAGLGPRYAVVGEGRDGGDDGEHSSILVDTDRFEVLESAQQWLSDTPAVVGSTGWGATLPRILVRARLRDRATGRTLLHVNSHFDHASEQARVRSAEMVAAIVADSADPVLFTADANAAAERSAAYERLVGGTTMRDAWRAAGRRTTPEVGTFPGYGEPVPGGDRIDWVLVGPGIEVHEAAINTVRDGAGRWASDHAPVQAVLSLA